MNDIHIAQFQAKELYGVKLKDDEFEELALIALQRIGNKHVTLKRVTLTIDDNLEAELPCDCDIIEAVTNLFEDPYLTSNIYSNGDIYKTHVENYIESKKVFERNHYINGRYINYVKIGNKLKFEHNFKKVNLLYGTLIKSDDGMPLVTDSEIDAIAAFCAYVTLNKKGIVTLNAGLIQIANSIKAEWLRLRDHATVPEYINQNEMNDILDTKSSFDRKVHNKSYKPIK